MAERGQRADGLRNRARILEIAKDAFATDGPSVPLDQIAKLAGVGPGTVHRHFPTKESLLTAVVLDRLVGLADSAERASARADAGAAFYDFLRELTAEASKNLALTSALGGAGVGDVGAVAGARLSKGLAILLEQAKAAGAVRGDLAAEDIHPILGGVIRMEQSLPESHRGIGLAILLDGMRP
jgi:AcrR family transcriptional regulator